ncbi:MAG: DUF192 domain-containing protein [Bacteroidales bacterium]
MTKKQLFIITALIVISGILAIVYFSGKTKLKPEVSTTPKTEEAVFTKHGELSFIKAADNKLINTISVEFAKDEYSREKGLMYRRKMDEMQGMLFFFEDNAPRNFWMKNTYISLDIIYIGENKKIVSIQKSAIPLSEESLPSFKDAMYVLEVIAGFTDKYGIKEGDEIQFTEK